MPRFDANPRALDALQAQPAFRVALEVTTRAVAAEIKLAALPFRRTGETIRDIVVDGTRVKFTDPFAHLSEFGSANNAPQRNALRGIRAAGLRYEDRGPNRAS